MNIDLFSKEAIAWARMVNNVSYLVQGVIADRVYFNLRKYEEFFNESYKKTAV